MANNKIPFTYTCVIWTGILLALFGAYVAVFEPVLPIPDLAFGGVPIGSNQVGLAILSIGASLAAKVAIKIPKGTMVLGEGGKKRSFTEKVARKTPFFALVIIAGAIYLLIKSFS
jgi:hypothetical protein